MDTELRSSGPDRDIVTYQRNRTVPTARGSRDPSSYNHPTVLSYPYLCPNLKPAFKSVQNLMSNKTRVCNPGAAIRANNCQQAAADRN
eukprot:scaffold55894_cov23-Prasinocladus_malaysianus.AAC.1